MKDITTDKAYLLGLLVGGATIQGNSVQVTLPYKNWGDLKINPERGGTIAEDIVKRIVPVWKRTYDMDVYYKIGSDWKIISDKVSEALLDDLRSYGLPLEGEFRSIADIGKLVPILKSSTELTRQFIAGLVDTVGSMAPSHRRFTDEFQIVSFEFKGKNFSLVSELYSLFVSLGAIPDQVLWNHPNQHSGSDRYYRSWKKGFKLRVGLDDYMINGSFVSLSKKLSADENKHLQSNVKTTTDKNIRIGGLTCTHIDQDSSWLPPYIRGYIFIHFSHILSFLGVENPYTDSLKSYLDQIHKYISPFTILSKGSISEIEDIIDSESYLKDTKYTEVKYDIDLLLETYNQNSAKMLFGNTELDGFPVNSILAGIAYIVCANLGKNIMGKRVLGNFIENIKDNLSSINDIGIKIMKPDRGTCLHIQGGGYAVLVGYKNEQFVASLLENDGGYGYKLKKPNYSNCIKLKS